MLRSYLFLFLITASINMMANAADQYTLHQETPTTGSNIPAVTAIGDIDFNKRYADLTPNEVASVKNQYEKLGDQDEPPYPINGMKPLMNDIVRIQSAVLASGDLFAAVSVDAKGDGQSVKFYQIPDPEMTNPIAFVLLKTKYKPALCSGQPCAMDFPFKMKFKVKL
ncbi:hypothetical protein [Aquirhabdus parva]|uniref:TonB C-terminal domain-containing protein n=1 Tax=Aquirhabdus parva TaxID=2283318 RepID=A0A345P3U4_9GAMM|nr:hypothetical protein [Aquirhabdus parva]AXI01953.1 hypothetical protein HYN46_03150 [Aquirhabdus parva]